MAELKSSKRGRPIGSNIRQNLIDLLFVKGKAFGYELSKSYNQIFPKCTSRVIYYHLNKGVQLGEFKVSKIVKEEGDFSWGSTVERIYYQLGEKAAPKDNEQVKQWLKENRLVVNKKNVFV
ncbi:hypothetical protein J4434_02185 [Candidatus Woesearchaeota archaeon]|nr:hypothetical protein [Candidatus Woesearchaeota archaeon]